jgi:hypothetical protein
MSHKIAKQNRHEQRRERALQDPEIAAGYAEAGAEIEGQAKKEGANEVYMVHGKQAYYIYSPAGAGPYEVTGLADFCREWELNLQDVKDMLRGRRKNVQGWYIDPERTRKFLKRAREIAAMFGYDLDDL